MSNKQVLPRRYNPYPLSTLRLLTVMLIVIRVCLLSLLLSLAFPAASKSAGQDDLATQKELLQQKIDSNKELAQKDVDALKARIDAFDKRVDDQVNRVADVGYAVDRFGVIAGGLGLLITVIGLFGYLSVAKQAQHEAQESSKKWFADNAKELMSEIDRLKSAANQGHQVINNTVSNFTILEEQAKKAVAEKQKDIFAKPLIDNALNSEAQGGREVSEQASENRGSPSVSLALQKCAEEIKNKPESSYSFDDWNTRAFEAYQSEKYEEAALYWKNASMIPNTEPRLVSQSLLNRAVALFELKRYHEAVSVYEPLITQYGSDASPAIREQVVKAMLIRGLTLGQLNRLEEKLAAYEQVIGEYGSDASPAIREQVVKAMLNRGLTLGQLNKPEEELAAYEQLIGRYGLDVGPAIREQVVMAMFNQGVTLGQLNRQEEKLAVYEQLIGQYGLDVSPAICERVVTAMLSRGVTLGQLNKPEEALAAYEQVIGVYGLDASPAIRERVVMVMLNRGLTLGQLNKPEEALAAYEQLIGLYGSDASPAIREWVMTAMLHRGLTLGQLNRQEEKLATYEQVIGEYGLDASPAIREYFANALNCRGFDRLLQAKEFWGDAEQRATLLGMAQADLERSLELLPGGGSASGNLAYVQWLQGEAQSSEDAFRAGLQSSVSGGEDLYQGTLEDIAQHPIPPDAGFRTMVERVWGEYQAAQSAKA